MVAVLSTHLYGILKENFLKCAVGLVDWRSVFSLALC